MSRCGAGPRPAKAPPAPNWAGRGPAPRRIYPVPQAQPNSSASGGLRLVSMAGAPKSLRIAVLDAYGAAGEERRDEFRRGTQDCVRHKSRTVCTTVKGKEKKK